MVVKPRPKGKSREAFTGAYLPPRITYLRSLIARLTEIDIDVDEEEQEALDDPTADDVSNDGGDGGSDDGGDGGSNGGGDDGSNDDGIQAEDEAADDDDDDDQPPPKKRKSNAKVVATPIRVRERALKGKQQHLKSYPLVIGYLTTFQCRRNQRGSSYRLRG